MGTLDRVRLCSHGRSLSHVPDASMRPGVLDAVVGQLPAALLLAIADAELEVGIVLVAPAALRADARAALGRGRERAGKALAAGGDRRLPADSREEGSAAEEEPVEHGRDDTGPDVGAAGGERVEEPGRVE